jgi:hypothetical protein
VTGEGQRHVLRGAAQRSARACLRWRGVGGSVLVGGMGSNVGALAAARRYWGIGVS